MGLLRIYLIEMFGSEFGFAKQKSLMAFYLRIFLLFLPKSYKPRHLNKWSG
jgi:hypothetical protein